jgi:hypothetical protein
VARRNPAEPLRIRIRVSSPLPGMTQVWSLVLSPASAGQPFWERGMEDLLGAGVWAAGHETCEADAE